MTARARFRRVAVVCNPAAGHGRCAQALPGVVSTLRAGGCDVHALTTERPGHAAALAAEAVRDGCDLIVALGGDGTVNEVVSGLLANDVAGQIPVAVVPAGTGNSFARDFGLTPQKRDEAIARLMEGQARSIDAARVDYQAAGTMQTAYCINVFGIGFMAQVADATNRRFKALGGLGYSLAVFWQLAALRAPSTRVEVEYDGQRTTLEEPMPLVAVCNSQWTGDKMWIAPQADASDGALDVLTLGRLSRLELIRLFPRIFGGTHLAHPAVQTMRAHRITLAPETPSPLLIDGEVLGTTPVTVEVLPGAFSVVV